MIDQLAAPPSAASPESTPSISTKWNADKVVAPFYSYGNTVVYDEIHQVLFSMHDGAVCIVDPLTIGILGRISTAGDVVLNFALIPEAKAVLVLCRSQLIRCFTIEWSNWRTLRSRSGETCARAAENIITTSQVRAWKGPTSPVTTFAMSTISPFLLAVGTGLGSVHVYSVKGGYCTHAYHSAKGKVTLLKFHPKRQILFIGFDNGAIEAYDLYRHLVLCSLADHLSGVTDVAFVQPDTSNTLGGLISSGKDKVVNLWNLDSLDTELRIWFQKKMKKDASTEMGTYSSELVKAGCSLTRVERSLGVRARSKSKKRAQPDFSSYQSDDESGDPSWWIDSKPEHSSTISPLHQFSTQEITEALLCVPTRLMDHCYVQTSEGTKLKEACPWVAITGGESGTLNIWNPSTREKLMTIKIPGNSGGILSLTYHRDQSGVPVLISVTENRTICFWELQSCHIQRILHGNATELIHCQFVPVSPNHHQIHHQLPNIKQETAPASQRKQKKRSIQNEDEVMSQIDEGMEDVVMESEAMPYERVLLLRSDSDCVLMELSSGRASSFVLSGHTATILSADVSIDGCWIATGAKNNEINIWSSRLLKSCARITGHTSPIVAVQMNKRMLKGMRSCSCIADEDLISLPTDLTAGGSFIASICVEGILKIWKLDLNQLRQTCCVSDSTTSLNLEITEAYSSVVAHEKEVHGLAVAPNDKLVATCSSDKSIKIWSIPHLKLIGTCYGHSRAVWAVRFSPTEKIVASGGGDQMIKLWSLSDFSCLKSFQGHTGSVLNVDFLTLGTQLISSSSDGLVKLWNVRMSDCVGTFDAHDGQKVWSLNLNSSRTRIVTCGEDNKLIIWRDDTAVAAIEEAEIRKLEQAQSLQIISLAREGKTIEALSLAVRLRKPFQAFDMLTKSSEQNLFAAVDETALQSSKEDAISKVFTKRLNAEKLQPVKQEELILWIQALKDDQLKVLIEFLQRWNSNGETSGLANTILEILLKTVPSKTLARVEGLPTLSKMILAYNSRHVARVSALLQRSFILDMILFSGGFKSITDFDDLPSRHQLGDISKTNENSLSTEDAYDVLFK